MKLSATTTQTVTTEIEIEPKMKLHLAAMLDTLIDLQLLQKGLQQGIDAEKKKIFDTLELLGTDKLLLDGQHMTIVRGLKSTLDKKKLYAMGITEAQIKAATTTKPKKAYLTVRAAGETEEVHETDE